MKKLNNQNNNSLKSKVYLKESHSVSKAEGVSQEKAKLFRI